MTPRVKVEDGRRIKFLDQDQLRRFFDAMPSESIRDRLLFGLMYRFGMRVSDVVQLMLGQWIGSGEKSRYRASRAA